MLILVPLLILNLSAVYFADRHNLSRSIAYSILLMGSLNAIYIAAIVNLLIPGTILVFGILILMSVLGIYNVFSGKMKIKKDIYILLNNLSAITFTIIFAIQKPVLYYWDELRLWGPGAKALKEFGKLYSIGINPTHMDRKYPVGNSILNYFFGFFDSDYSEIILLLSYAFLFFAAFTALSYFIYYKTQNHSLGIISYFMFLLSPFLINFHAAALDFSNISYAYGTTLVDMNLSVVFAMAIVIYLYRPKAYWHVLPLMFLITIKKSGIFFSLLALCIIGCFEIFFIIKKKTNIKNATFTILITLIIPIITYVSWNIHLDLFKIPTEASDYTFTISRQESLATEIYGYEEILPEEDITPLSIFFPHLRTERYKGILEEMKVFFKTNKDFAFIKDIHLIVLLVALTIIMAITADKGRRLITLVASLGLTAGCFVYTLIIGYQMQFYGNMMVEYPRYMISYYYGWALIIFTLFISLSNINEIIKKSMIAFVLVISVLYVEYTGLEYTIINSPDNVYSVRMYHMEKCRPVSEVLKKGDRVYVVYPSDNSELLLHYSYNLLPAYVNLDTKHTGIDFTRPFRAIETVSEDFSDCNIADERTFASIMNDYYDYVYVVDADKEFIESYSGLFEDEISNNTLYKVSDLDVPMQKVVI